VNAQDFGAYLEKVDERDVDLLLLEEFHANTDFVTWFSLQCGFSNVRFDGAWHSVTDADGETDLLLRVRFGETRIGILIENKVAASLQDRQDERYHLRAARSQNEGKFDLFRVCLCAPQNYLDGAEEASLFQHRLSYEAIADWFSNQIGPRANWRRYVMQEAVEQGRRGYKMVVSQENSEFHMDYWLYLCRKHPMLTMNKPTPKGKSSNWIIMKGVRFPKGVQLHYKIDQCTMELGFTEHSIEELIAHRSQWPDGIRPVARGKYARAALVIDVSKVDMSKGMLSQEASIEVALRAAYRLLPFASIFSVADSAGDVEA